MSPPLHLLPTAHCRVCRVSGALPFLRAQGLLRLSPAALSPVLPLPHKADEHFLIRKVWEWKYLSFVNTDFWEWTIFSKESFTEMDPFLSFSFWDFFGKTKQKQAETISIHFGSNFPNVPTLTSALKPAPAPAFAIIICEYNSWRKNLPKFVLKCCYFMKLWWLLKYKVWISFVQPELEPKLYICSSFGSSKKFQLWLTITGKNCQTSFLWTNEVVFIQNFFCRAPVVVIGGSRWRVPTSAHPIEITTVVGNTTSVICFLILSTWIFLFLWSDLIFWNL